MFYAQALVMDLFGNGVDNTEVENACMVLFCYIGTYISLVYHFPFGVIDHRFAYSFLIDFLLCSRLPIAFAFYV